MNKQLLPLLPAILLCGCVATSKYEAARTESQSQKQRADAVEAKAAQLAKDLDASKKTGDDLSIKLQASADQLAGLHKSNKDLQESLDANKSQLSQKAAGLIKERDELTQKLSAQQAQSSELAKKLADAEAARKALEDAKTAELAQVKKSYEDLTLGLKSEISAGQVQITQLKGKLTVNMVDQILFDSGHADIKPEGKKVLDKVGGLLNNVQDKDIRIEGHTDNKPIVGELREKYPSNWELSTARGTAVARYLEAHAKVDPTRLVAAGYGAFRPKTSNETPEGRAQNRRIEIILIPRD